MKEIKDYLIENNFLILSKFLFASSSLRKVILIDFLFFEIVTCLLLPIYFFFKISISLTDNFGFKIDYIHGKDECIEIASKGKNVAIVYDEFSHETLFDDVVKHGSLCRKSFSIGEAQDKRFYLEAQKIN